MKVQSQAKKSLNKTNLTYKGKKKKKNSVMPSKLILKSFLCVGLQNNISWIGLRKMTMGKFVP